MSLAPVLRLPSSPTILCAFTDLCVEVTFFKPKNSCFCIPSKTDHLPNQPLAAKFFTMNTYKKTGGRGHIFQSQRSCLSALFKASHLANHPLATRHCLLFLSILKA